MNKKKLIRFSESFLVLPVMTMLMPFGSVPTDLSHNIQAPQTVLIQKQNIVGSLLTLNQVDDEKTKTLQAEGDAIDAYFKDHNMPLEGTGLKMAQEADKNGLDYRLLPAISAIESTGGRHVCKRVKFNPFGWGSCKIGFDSYDEAIEIVAKNLGGNNPNTEKHYADKSTDEILKAYNPPSIVPNYVKKVRSQMDEIGKEKIEIPETSKDA